MFFSGKLTLLISNDYRNFHVSHNFVKFMDKIYYKSQFFPKMIFDKKINFYVKNNDLTMKENILFSIKS